jgi:hypothetical protein
MNIYNSFMLICQQKNWKFKKNRGDVVEQATSLLNSGNIVEQATSLLIRGYIVEQATSLLNKGEML